MSEVLAMISALRHHLRNVATVSVSVAKQREEAVMNTHSVGVGK